MMAPNDQGVRPHLQKSWFNDAYPLDTLFSLAKIPATTLPGFAQFPVYMGME
jgi:hypothetical protein